MLRFLIGSVLLLTCASVYAQTTTATIIGTVRDTSGGVIPKANVKAKMVATNQVREVDTDPDGDYVLTNLPIGDYEITVSATGFRTEVHEGITLQVAQRARLDVILQTGSVTESVNVYAAVPIVNTEDAVYGDVIENKRVVELPLNGRNFNSLALLTPNIQSGVPGGATLQNFLAGGIAVWAHGARDTDNEWNLDAATMTELLDVAGHLNVLDLLEAERARFTPDRKLGDGDEVGLARIFVADICRKEFPEAFAAILRS